MFPSSFCQLAVRHESAEGVNVKELSPQRRARAQMGTCFGLLKFCLRAYIAWLCADNGQGSSDVEEDFAPLADKLIATLELG